MRVESNCQLDLHSSSDLTRVEGSAFKLIHMVIGRPQFAETLSGIAIINIMEIMFEYVIGKL